MTSQEGHVVISSGFLPKTHSLKLIMRKQWTDRTLRDTATTARVVLSTSVKVVNEEEKPKELSLIRGD